MVLYAVLLLSVRGTVPVPWLFYVIPQKGDYVIVYDIILCYPFLTVLRESVKYWAQNKNSPKGNLCVFPGENLSLSENQERCTILSIRLYQPSVSYSSRPLKVGRPVTPKSVRCQNWSGGPILAVQPPPNLVRMRQKWSAVASWQSQK